MKEELNKNQWFYWPYLLLVLICSSIVIVFSKAEIHIWMNQHQPIWLDSFFKLATNLGDGIFLPVFIIIMLFISFRYSLLMLISFLFSGLIVQVLKHTIFHEMMRPAKYFDKIYHLRLVEGVNQYYSHSFPSGHAATAFVFFLCFAMIIKEKRYKFVMLFFAVLVAYSRVYLSQHFLVDILGGSIIGVLTTYAGSIWLCKLDKNWLNTNLLTISRNTKHENIL